MNIRISHLFIGVVSLLLGGAGSSQAQGWTLTRLATLDYGGPNSLIQGADGDFYGTTLRGGTYLGGVAFKITAAGVLTTFASFNFDAFEQYDKHGNPIYPPQDGPTSLMQASDGNFYGTAAPHTYPSLFAPDALTYKITTNGDVTSDRGLSGSYPSGALVEGNDGYLYGTTSSGGNFALNQGQGDGTAFKMALNSTVTTQLTSFNDTNRGPIGALILGNDGNFYGVTTGFPNVFAAGSVYKMTPGGSVTTLVSFNGPNGFSPHSALVQGKDGNFYGTTFFGGATYGNNATQGDGSIFRLTTNGTLTTLVSFNGQNGASPNAALIQKADGNFYGITASGGAYGYGTFFKMATNGTLITLVSFNNTNGATPNALVLAKDGNFYGTTSSDINGDGTFFKIVPFVPVLQLSLAGHQTTLSWSTNNANGFVLSSSTNLTSPTWLAVTNVPVVVSNQMQVSIPMIEAARFSGLIRPDLEHFHKYCSVRL